MKKDLLKDISASTIQVVLNQLLGLLIFIIISRYLQKSIYGELNWSLAILTFVFTTLSLRLEQIVVRKVAAGNDPSKMLALFTGHVLVTGFVFYLLLSFCGFLFPSFFQQHQLLLMLAISQLLSFISSPFKQIANGKEFFGLLAIMSSVSNLVRVILLLWVVFFSVLTIHQVLVVYIVSALVELLINIYIVRYRLNISACRWILKDYFFLLNESLPQIGSVFLNACIARIDWILLGIFSGAVITAEYSFAYKVFELCPLPLLILGPILLSRFSKYFSQNAETALFSKKTEIGFFIRCEMIAATSIPLVINIVWSPLIDTLTNNKYGEINKMNFLLLSLCLPFQYMNNLLWTVEFAQNRLRRIFKITAVTCLIIFAGDLLMIPLLNAKGAAIVYLTATITEYFIYMRISIISKVKESWHALFFCMAAMMLSGIAAGFMTDTVFLRLFLSVGIYCMLLFVTGQLKKHDLQLIRNWLYKKQPIYIKQAIV